MALSSQSFASDIRASFDIGYGGMGATSTTGSQRNEGPIVFALGADYSFDPRIAIGIEERRSYDLNLGSLVGVTNLLSRWYFITPQPSSSLLNDKTSLVQKNISPYLMGAVGLMQASIASRNLALESDINMIGMSITGAVGAEYQVWQNAGLRLELGFGQTALGSTGTGQLLYFNLGAYLCL